MKYQPLKFRNSALTYVLWRLLIAMVIIGPSTPSFATEPDTEPSSEPIRITADLLVTETRTKSAEFSGNVHATQGGTQIKADRLTLHYQSGGDPSQDKDASTISRITAHGHVRIRFDNRLAVSEQAVYITSERKLVLVGPGSKVTSGQDEIVGSKITYFRDDGRVAIEGDGKNRVKAVFHSDQRGLN